MLYSRKKFGLALSCLFIFLSSLSFNASAFNPFGFVQDVIGQGVNTITQFIKPIVDNPITNAIGHGVEAVIDVVEQGSNAVMSVFALVSNIVGDVLGSVQEIIANVIGGNPIGDFILGVGDSVSSAVNNFIFLRDLSPNVDLGDYTKFETVMLQARLRKPDINNKVTEEDLAEAQYALPVVPTKAPPWYQSRYNWRIITLDRETTGAACMNGSPYRFAVKESPYSRNLVMTYQGGGACWDYYSCTKTTGALGTVNPQGIYNFNSLEDFLNTEHILNLVQMFATSPIYNEYTGISNYSYFPILKTTRWNKVWLGYCTGDVHLGAGIKQYTGFNIDNEETETITAHHVGMLNQRAVAAWIKNNITKPKQLLLHGISAGGTAVMAGMINYDQLGAERGFVLNDSGPLFLADRTKIESISSEGEIIYTDNSANLHTRVEDSWNLEQLYTYVINKFAPQYANDEYYTKNYGRINGVVAEIWPTVRFGWSSFWKDGVYSRFTYNFLPGFEEAEDKLEFVEPLWREDMTNFESYLDDIPNFGYYNPGYRSIISSHTASSFTFLNSGIENLGLTYWDFANNLINGEPGTPVMQATEKTPEEIAADINRFSGSFLGLNLEAIIKQPVSFIFDFVLAFIDL